jgi:hypothetical protein
MAPDSDGEKKSSEEKKSGNVLVLANLPGPEPHR